MIQEINCKEIKISPRPLSRHLETVCDKQEQFTMQEMCHRDNLQREKWPLHPLRPQTLQTGDI